MHSDSGAHCARRQCGCRSRLTPSRVGFRFWASPFPSRLANASGRIVFNMVLFMDWQFASGCSPPRPLGRRSYLRLRTASALSDGDFHPTVGVHSQAH